MLRRSNRANNWGQNDYMGNSRCWQVWVNICRFSVILAATYVHYRREKQRDCNISSHRTWYIINNHPTCVSQVSNMIIKRRLRFYMRTDSNVPYPSRLYTVKCNYCDARSISNSSDWICIIFGDESCFLLYPDDYRRPVRPVRRCPDTLKILPLLSHVTQANDRGYCLGFNFLW